MHQVFVPCKNTRIVHLYSATTGLMQTHRVVQPIKTSISRLRNRNQSSEIYYTRNLAFRSVSALMFKIFHSNGPQLLSHRLHIRSIGSCGGCTLERQIHHLLEDLLVYNFPYLRIHQIHRFTIVVFPKSLRKNKHGTAFMNLVLRGEFMQRI